MNSKRIIGKLLMAFVLISLGFAAGKEAAWRSLAQSGGERTAVVAGRSEPVPREGNPAGAGGDRDVAGADADRKAAEANGSEQALRNGDGVIVYYMHATFRCFTCNSIESMAKEVVENDFAMELAEGRLEMHSVNFMENIALGRRYGVGTSTLVIVRLHDGREAEFKRLDGVWTHVNDPAAFMQYVAEHIRNYLAGGTS